MSSPRSAEDGDPRRVAVLGSTGSIGRQALDVLALHPEAFRVTALAAGSDGEQLTEQATRFGVSVTALGASGEELAVRFREGMGHLAQVPGSNFYRRIREKFGHLAH